MLLKKILLLLLIGSHVCTGIYAQSKEATISYVKKMNLWKRIRNEQMRAMVTEFRTTRHNLLIADSVSLYTTIQETEEMNAFGGENGGGFGSRMASMMAAMDGDLYKNFNTATSLQAIEQMGRNFLISDSIKKQPWKISGETKTILNYPCMKATLKQKGGFGSFFGMGGRERTPSATPNADTSSASRMPAEIEVIAWFTTAIAVPAGPDNFGQLPGVILEMSIDSGTVVYSATSVKKEVAVKEVKPPKKGKPVTRDEFRKMMNEMSHRFSNNGGSAPPPNQ